MKSSFPATLVVVSALLAARANAQSGGDSHVLELKVGEALQNVQVESSVKVLLSGWARVDYGYGNRFGNASGKDELGISKMALKTDAQFENLDFIAVLGSTVLSDVPNDTSFKDLFIVWHQFGGGDATLILGAQPILFGLKPNGYPGDRSLQPSIEFGGAGAFAVSNQAGPSVRLQYPVQGIGTFEAGVFDSAANNGAVGSSLDGSRLYRNYFGQMRVEDMGVKGLSGVVGYEGLYVGGADDSVEPILDIGVDYRTDRFDASLEYISLDQNVTGTTDDETYTVAELTAFLSGGWQAMADYANADELDAKTIRLGTQLALTPHSDLNLEWAHDTLGGASDADSGQVRLTFHF